MFIDEKGKLFGKISIIDILIIVLVIVAILGLCFAFTQVKSNGILTENKSLVGKQTDLNSLDVKMRIKEVREVTVSAVKIGDEVFDADTNKLIGEITSVDVLETEKAITDINGKAYISKVPQRYDLLLNVKVPGKLTDNGYMTANNIHLAYGSTIEIKTPTINTFPTIETISVAK